MKLYSYKELIAWQKSIDLVEEIFKVTSGFPKSEIYGLSNQMRRAAISIPSNIAEGAGRSHTKEFIQFLHIAEGSANELETQLIIVKRLNFLSEAAFNRLNEQLTEIIKMIVGLIKKLSYNSSLATSN